MPRSACWPPRPSPSRAAPIPPPAPTAAPSRRRAAPAELTKIRVAALPIAETGALWAAIDEGIFAEHGLEVEVVPAQGGAQAIPALLSGDIQFAIGQPFGPFRADLQDLGVVIIGDYANSLADRQGRQRGRRSGRLRASRARRISRASRSRSTASALRATSRS